jgi:hypothetical protein
MGSGAPEVPELPTAWGYSWVTQHQGDINSEDWSSRLGVGRKASDLTLENISCCEVSNRDSRIWISQRRPLLRPRIMKTDLNDLKVLKVRNWEELAMDRTFGMTCLRKPKPTKGCSANGRRRIFFINFSATHIRPFSP